MQRLRRSSGDSIKPSDHIRLFVQDVVDFSSQYGKENTSSYTVANIRSRPHYYPKYGDFLESSVLRTYGPWWQSPSKILISAQPLFISTDFIEIRFEHRLLIESVSIYETYNPGAVCVIYAFDYKRDRWQRIWSVIDENKFKSNREACKRPLPPKASRIFKPNLTVKNVFSDKLRLEFEHSELEYYTELDAVEISGIAYDKEATVQVAKNLKTTANFFEDITKRVIDLSLNDSNTQKEKEANEDKNKLDEVREEIGEKKENAVVNIKPASNTRRMSRELLVRQNSTTKSIMLEKGAGVISCNNIVDLPSEILCMILTYLDLGTIFKLRSTCHTFYELCSLAFLYSKIDLQPYWNLIDENFIDFIPSLTDNITMLNLSWIKIKQFESAQFLFEQSCQNLTVLQLNSCSFMDGHLLTVVTSCCPKLTSLSLRSCTNIESIRDDTRNAFSQISKLVDLKDLDLYRTLCTNVAIGDILAACTRIESLNLGSCVKITDFDNVMCLIGRHLKGIRSLDLWRAYSLTGRGIAELANNCFELEELDIGWCRSVAPIDRLQDLIKNCKNIKKLFLTSLKVTDDELELISKHSTNLEKLDILGSNLVSYEGIELVLHKCKQLKMFDISFCNRIDSQTHRFLCEVYTQCSIKKSFQSES